MKEKHEIAMLGESDRIDILLEEYRSLNKLLLFRLNAMDRRLPASAGFLAAAFASMLALPPDSRAVVLIGIPTTVFWVVRSTVQHAKAKEDHLRRIDEIERAVNEIAGEELLVFQSRHPAGVSAGRTGQTTVFASVLGGLFTLLLCVFLFLKNDIFLPRPLFIWYVAFISVDCFLAPFRLSRYRYRRQQVHI